MKPLGFAGNRSLNPDRALGVGSFFYDNPKPKRVPIVHWNLNKYSCLTFLIFKWLLDELWSLVRYFTLVIYPLIAKATGANRGIGFKLVQVLGEHEWSVFGTVRPETRTDPSFTEASMTSTLLLLSLLTTDSL